MEDEKGRPMMYWGGNPEGKSLSVDRVVHTPGPWRVIEGTHSADKRFSVVSENENITGWGCVQQLEGNARLIAAAPELLAACQAALEEVQHFSHGTVKQLADAVSKATEEVV